MMLVTLCFDGSIKNATSCNTAPEINLLVTHSEKKSMHRADGTQDRLQAYTQTYIDGGHVPIYNLTDK